MRAPTLLRLACASAFAAAASAGSGSFAGSGRFNKAFCLHGRAWGNASFWEAAAARTLAKLETATAVALAVVHAINVVPGSVPDDGFAEIEAVTTAAAETFTVAV